MEPEVLGRAIVRDLKSHAVPGGNPKLQAYLGSPYPVLGLTTPEIRRVMKKHHRVLGSVTTGQLNELARVLSKGQTYEEESFAISLFDHYSKRLDEKSWALMNHWIDQFSGWALCDTLGSGPISSMLYANQNHFDEVQDWSRSDNMWRRRISAYSLSSFVFAGELEKPFALLKGLLYDEEFWVQRAVGTWLRECWKKDGKRTEAFLLRHVKGLPRVVITVATERAPKGFREELRRRRTGQQKQE